MLVVPLNTHLSRLLMAGEGVIKSMRLKHTNSASVASAISRRGQCDRSYAKSTTQTRRALARGNVDASVLEWIGGNQVTSLGFTS